MSDEKRADSARPAQDPADDKRYLLVGRISGLYGIRGWVRVYSYTECRQDILDYTPWYLKRDGRWSARRPIKGRLQGGTVVAALEGIDSRDSAALWMGREIAIRREQLPSLEEGRYYWADLVGLRVFTLQGSHLGRVKRLLETGANDILAVEGERERLIPFLTGAVVKRVDLSQGVLVVDWDPDF